VPVVLTKNTDKPTVADLLSRSTKKQSQLAKKETGGPLDSALENFNKLYDFNTKEEKESSDKEGSSTFSETLSRVFGNVFTSSISLLKSSGSR